MKRTTSSSHAISGVFVFLLLGIFAVFSTVMVLLSARAYKGAVDRLAAQEPLDAKCRDHELSGDYSGFRECHIEPDWLLIYRVDDRELVLLLFRTGTHSDLF